MKKCPYEQYLWKISLILVFFQLLSCSDRVHTEKKPTSILSGWIYAKTANNKISPGDFIRCKDNRTIIAWKKGESGLYRMRIDKPRELIPIETLQNNRIFYAFPLNNSSITDKVLIISMANMTTKLDIVDCQGISVSPAKTSVDHFNGIIDLKEFDINANTQLNSVQSPVNLSDESDILDLNDRFENAGIWLLLPIKSNENTKKVLYYIDLQNLQAIKENGSYDQIGWSGIGQTIWALPTRVANDPIIELIYPPSNQQFRKEVWTFSFTKGTASREDSNDSRVYGTKPNIIAWEINPQQKQLWIYKKSQDEKNVLFLIEDNEEKRTCQAVLKEIYIRNFHLGKLSSSNIHNDQSFSRMAYAIYEQNKILHYFRALSFKNYEDYDLSMEPSHISSSSEVNNISLVELEQKNEQKTLNIILQIDAKIKDNAGKDLLKSTFYVDVISRANHENAPHNYLKSVIFEKVSTDAHISDVDKSNESAIVMQRRRNGTGLIVQFPAQKQDSPRFIESAPRIYFYNYDPSRNALTPNSLFVSAFMALQDKDTLTIKDDIEDEEADVVCTSMQCLLIGDNIDDLACPSESTFQCQQLERIYKANDEIRNKTYLVIFNGTLYVYQKVQKNTNLISLSLEPKIASKAVSEANFYLGQARPIIIPSNHVGLSDLKLTISDIIINGNTQINGKFLPIKLETIIDAYDAIYDPGKTLEFPGKTYSGSAIEINIPLSLKIDSDTNLSDNKSHPLILTYEDKQQGLAFTITSMQIIIDDQYPQYAAKQALAVLLVFLLSGIVLSFFIRFRAPPQLVKLALTIIIPISATAGFSLNDKLGSILKLIGLEEPNIGIWFGATVVYLIIGAVACWKSASVTRFLASYELLDTFAWIYLQLPWVRKTVLIELRQLMKTYCSNIISNLIDDKNYRILDNHYLKFVNNEVEVFQNYSTNLSKKLLALFVISDSQKSMERYHLLIHGKGGTGKSYVLWKIVEALLNSNTTFVPITCDLSIEKKTIQDILPEFLTKDSFLPRLMQDVLLSKGELLLVFDNISEKNSTTQNLRDMLFGKSGKHLAVIASSRCSQFRTIFSKSITIDNITVREKDESSKLFTEEVSNTMLPLFFILTKKDEHLACMDDDVLNARRVVTIFHEAVKNLLTRYSDQSTKIVASLTSLCVAEYFHGGNKGHFKKIFFSEASTNLSERMDLFDILCESNILLSLDSSTVVFYNRYLLFYFTALGLIGFNLHKNPPMEIPEIAGKILIEVKEKHSNDDELSLMDMCLALFKAEIKEPKSE